jgi:hypothetical protein
VSGGDRRNADARIIAALAGGATREDAARQAGVGVATVYRRLTEPGFRAAVQQARGEMVSQSVGTLARIASAAAITLGLLLKAESESVRLGAARAILELGCKLRESEELEARIQALEESAQTMPSPRRGHGWAA